MLNTLEKDVKTLSQTVANQSLQLADQQVQINELKTAYEAEVEKRLALQRLIFGKKSERFVALDEDHNQLPLFDLDSDQDDIKEEDLENITYTRKKGKKSSFDRSVLPQREIIIRVPDHERQCACGCEKEVIRYETKHQLHYIPATMEVQVIKREVMACRKGCGNIGTAPVQPHILPKARVTESLLAYIVVSKVLDRQPLYHLEKKLEREHDWHISRNTMARWMILLADKLQPLINLMKDEVLGYDIASIDATTIQVLNEPNRASETKSQAYCIRGGPPGKEVTLYEYNGYKQRDYVTDLFADYKGSISSDASPVFNGLKLNPQIRMSYCHAHARRKFDVIEKARMRGKKKRKKGLAYHVLKHVYQPLYAIEAYVKEKEFSPEQVNEYRHKHAKPILDTHKKWLDHHHELTPGQSPIRKAIEYSLTHWTELMEYVEDGRLPIDNNATERDIKPFVIARKNFLFATTIEGADALSVHFSLIISGKRHGLDPMAYYRYILEQVPLCESLDDYEKLLPWNIDKLSI